jgi:hypothetical protein
VRTIRAQLEGVDAEPGRVAAADVARIIIGLERAIARAAYLVLGKPRRSTGRYTQVVEGASRLRFVAVESGSFVGVLALPDASTPSDEELPIPVADLSSQAFRRLLGAIVEDRPDTDAELAEAIAMMAADLGIGDRNTSITLSSESTGQESDGPIRATIDSVVRERMQRLGARIPPVRDEAVVGVLFEADFEANTARVRLVDGAVATVTFPADLADRIYDALRLRARLDGIVSYHPRTHQVTGIELRAVVRSTQLPLDLDSFWETDTFSGLQAAQGTTGLVDPDSLIIDGLNNDERVAFLAALAE